jgi:hypothetical protein
VTRYDLFWFLLVTVLMIAAGVREIRIGNAKTATALIAIPVCGWIALLFGR